MFSNFHHCLSAEEGFEVFFEVFRRDGLFVFGDLLDDVHALFEFVAAEIVTFGARLKAFFLYAGKHRTFFVVRDIGRLAAAAGPDSFRRYLCVEILFKCPAEIRLVRIRQLRFERRA